MKTKVSPAIVGAFVIGAFALGMIALLSFGSLSLFSKPQRFIVNFNESIHGLDLGSPVKLRGVRVGRVVDLNVQFDEAAKKSVVRVICEFNRNIITDGNGGMVDITSREVLQGLVDKGLRAQLGVIGLATGLLFVELDFMDPVAYPDTHHTTDIRYATVPSVLSTISEFQASISEILADMKHINFTSLADEFHGLMVDTRQQVNALEVKDLITQWTAAARSVDAVASSPELKETLVNLNLAAVDLRTMLAKLDGKIDPASENLARTLEHTRQTLETFNAAAQTLRKFINAQQNLGDDANQALNKLAGAADAVQRLADFIERNPQALLTGRKRPE
ncbi:MAG: MlaD family protein [Cephaloticoccus sp.]|nr:MlaD family protein [Cephaloticoccus sp.]